MGMERFNAEKYRLRLGGMLGRVNWKIVLVVGIALSAVFMLYHTWMFMTIANL